MVSPEFVNVFTYRHEVVVEVAITEPDEDLSVRTFQFEYADDDRLAPKQDVGDRFEAAVTDALESHGFVVHSAG